MSRPASSCGETRRLAHFAELPDWATVTLEDVVRLADVPDTRVQSWCTCGATRPRRSPLTAEFSLGQRLAKVFSGTDGAYHSEASKNQHAAWLEEEARCPDLAGGVLALEQYDQRRS